MTVSGVSDNRGLFSTGGAGQTAVMDGSQSGPVLHAALIYSILKYFMLYFI